ncbi:MAG: hypothetical protein COW59_02135 [Lysobacterales bacterium CG17_big_fil_post_rev_8_21_14_2_50_64_11]|nr:MAG: hypothetical protein COW59_02135 [Xanthomonadales bacterium CG17_big_fil_post_rev_8_21_14_2_50_64_11]PIX59441.1 MAG: hypothetical protein COZ47_12475 [Xanthomonadales bacterium CG_4_10_14_3_um_filter_64_11]
MNISVEHLVEPKVQSACCLDCDEPCNEATEQRHFAARVVQHNGQRYMMVAVTKNKVAGASRCARLAKTAHAACGNRVADLRARL